MINMSPLNSHNASMTDSLSYELRRRVLQSGGPEFKSSSLPLINLCLVPKFNSSTLVLRSETTV